MTCFRSKCKLWTAPNSIRLAPTILLVAFRLHIVVLQCLATFNLFWHHLTFPRNGIVRNSEEHLSSRHWHNHSGWRRLLCKCKFQQKTDRVVITRNFAYTVDGRTRIIAYDTMLASGLVACRHTTRQLPAWPLSQVCPSKFSH